MAALGRHERSRFESVDELRIAGVAGSVAQSVVVLLARRGVLVAVTVERLVAAEIYDGPGDHFRHVGIGQIQAPEALCVFGVESRVVGASLRISGRRLQDHVCPGVRILYVEVLVAAAVGVDEEDLSRLWDLPE